MLSSIAEFWSLLKFSHSIYIIVVINCFLSPSFDSQLSFVLLFAFLAFLNAIFLK